jgi:hypothetical protein
MAFYEFGYLSVAKGFTFSGQCQCEKDVVLLIFLSVYGALPGV